MAHISKRNSRLAGIIGTVIGFIGGVAAAGFLLSHYTVTLTFAANISLLKLLALATIFNPMFLITVGQGVIVGMMLAILVTFAVLGAMNLFLTLAQCFGKKSTPKPPADAAPSTSLSSTPAITAQPSAANTTAALKSVVSRIRKTVSSNSNLPTRSDVVIDPAPASRAQTPR